MKRIFFVYIVILLLFEFSACTQKSSKEDNYYDEQAYIEVSITKGGDALKETGHKIYVYRSDTSRKMLKGFWENGNLQSISFFVNGQKEGKWTGYSEDGKISFEGNFMNGKKNGEFRTYHPEGNVSIIEKYNNGKETGVWYYYDTLNNLIRKEDHNAK